MTNYQFINVFSFVIMFSYDQNLSRHNLEYLYEKFNSFIADDIIIKSDEISIPDYINLQKIINGYKQTWNIDLSIKDINVLLFILKAGDIDKSPKKVINYFKICINEDTKSIKNYYCSGLHEYWKIKIKNYIDITHERFFKLNKILYE